MDFESEHMDYVMGYALTFKCIFCYDFIFIGTQYMIHDGKNIYGLKKLQKKH